MSSASKAKPRLNENGCKEGMLKGCSKQKSKPTRLPYFVAGSEGPDAIQPPMLKKSKRVEKFWDRWKAVVNNKASRSSESSQSELSTVTLQIFDDL